MEEYNPVSSSSLSPTAKNSLWLHRFVEMPVKEPLKCQGLFKKQNNSHPVKGIDYALTMMTFWRPLRHPVKIWKQSWIQEQRGCMLATWFSWKAGCRPPPTHRDLALTRVSFQGSHCWKFGLLSLTGGSVDRNPPASVGEMGSIPDLGRSHMLRSS